MTENASGPREVTITIDALSYGPYGIGRDEGRVILVPSTVPGDRVRVTIREQKKALRHR